MLLSKACVYGIRAVVYIATQENREYIPIREISNNLNISFHFLTKILQKLTQNNLIHSYRGANGGVSLARSAQSISLLDIIASIDGLTLFRECVLGLPDCGEEKPCPLHSKWDKERTELQNMFSASTLGDLAEKIRKFDYRLKQQNDQV